MDFQVITKYFEGIFSREQMSQLSMLGELYTDWNSKINVISRRDIENLYLHHVLHSLAIYKFLGPLMPGTCLLDFGTGGGFPGIPLAIAYPDAKFLLVDRIGKKIKVARQIADSIYLKNVETRQGDIGEIHNKFDYVVSRGVMRLDAMIPLVRKNIDTVNKNKYANGLICLKGGDMSEEMETVKYPVIEYPLGEFFNEPHFDEKKLIYVPMINTKK